MATIIPVERKKSRGWQAVVRRKGHKPIKKTFDLKGQAQAWATEQEALIQAKKYRDPRLAEMVTLQEALEKYREFGLLSKKAKSTLDREIYSRRHLERVLGEDTSLAEIDPMIINQYQSLRIEEGASNSSIRQELSMLSKMFTKARKAWGIPVENPVDDVERVPPGPERDRFLSTEEAVTVVNEAKISRNPNFYPFVLLLMHTGIRTGEAARLHSDRIDLRNRTVTINKTKSGKPRTVPLTKDVVEALSAIPKEGYYFLKENHLASPSTMLRPGCIFRECWKRLWERLDNKGIEVPHFTPHDLRHTAASHLLMAGVDIRVIADILGHSTLKMVMRYTHILDGFKQEVVEKISYLGK